MTNARTFSRRKIAAFATIVCTITVLLAISEPFRSNAQKMDDSQDVILAGTISGRVFQDFNGNGLYETSGGTTSAPTAIDTGVANVVVSAYDSAGVFRGSATTLANGTFSLAATGTGPYRVEFTSIPSGFLPSAHGTDSVLGGTAADSGSTVQFVNNGATANVNLALNRPQDFCADNPDLCSQVYGLGAGDQNDAVFTVPYTSGSTRTTGGLPVNDFMSPGNTSLATTGQVGATFGIAYYRPTRKIFVSSYMKKHTMFGPSGTGAIYQIDRATGLISVYADLNAIFGANTTGANPHNTSDYNTDNGQATWNAVGKISFGGMAISDDQSSLFVMNLANNRLYKIPTTGAVNNATITSAAFPTTMPNCTTASDVRPFAVNYYEGQVYVGAVCSRESAANATDTNLRAYVYTFDPATMSFSAAPVINFQLNYTRLETDPGLSAAWLNWKTNYTTISPSHFIYPQPMLTDIEFDRGNMIISLRDRDGDQSGYNSASNPNNSTQLFKGITAGDTLRACGSPTLGWTLESNGRCASIGGAPQNTNEGPGGGEYYYQDNYHPNGTPHDEVSNGAAMQIPGHDELVATVFDPPYLPTDNIYDSGGFRWFNNSTGAQNKGYLAFDAVNFGKANGMGNIQALCESAPLEIGNRVWNDANGNGVQDPGENGIAGVSVRLYQGGAPVAYLSSTPYADTFATVTYSGSSGSTNWSSTPWAEIGDDGSVTAGDVRVTADGTLGNALRLNRGNRGASRAISLGNVYAATLTFDYRRSASQGATAEYTTDGTTWTPVGTYTSGTDAAYVSSGAITLPATATGIRFMNGASNGNNQRFYVKNVVISTNSNTVVTDANGEYYFAGVKPNTAYELRVDNSANYSSGGPLFGLYTTIANQSTQAGDVDSSDSDGLNVVNPSGSPAGVFPVIALTTGGAGANNHTFDFGFRSTPTAAGVNVSGRITTANGNGIRNVQVMMTEADGTNHTAITGPFGYYSFTDIPSGQTVVMSIASKRFTFKQPVRLVTLNDDLVDYDWVSND